MARFISTFIACGILLLSCKNRHNPTTNTTTTLDPAARQKAIEEAKSKDLKYHFQSIHYPSKQIIQYFKDSFNIRILSASDFRSSKIAEENKAAEERVLLLTGQSLPNLLNTIH